MLASLAFLIGIIIGGVSLAAFRTRRPVSAADPVAGPTTLGWLALAFGATSAATFAAGMFAHAGIGGNLASIACAPASVIVGVGAVRGYDRFWPTWVGLAAGAVPGAFWIAFAVGNVLGLGG